MFKIIYSQEVMGAFEGGKPIVALESTIISHGMPYPQNMECAMEVEAVVRSNGAVPATIAVIEGNIHVGLDQDTLQHFASLGRENCMKVSVRDLSYCVANKFTGGTTVAGTMYICQNFSTPKIHIFATGGSGGVTRDDVWDVSADLVEFSRSPVMVVSAGIKSILDIPATLEVLETYGVPVVGFGTTNFPSFYSRISGHTVHLSVQDAADAAKMLKAHIDLNMKQGILLANPIPEEYEICADIMNPVIDEALEDCNKLGIKGKDMTPFLLGRIVELTEGKSLVCNIHLVKNNAKVAAQTAVEFNKLQ
ncbi:hypothetical protein PCE1_003954 [Barthelona sp. PCE]